LLFDYEGGGSALGKQFDWIKKPNPPKIYQYQYQVQSVKDENRLVPLMTGAKVRENKYSYSNKMV